MDDLQALVDRVGGWSTVTGVAVALFALLLLKRLLSRPKASAHHATVRCPDCGWVGSVSRYKPVCPKCARPLRV